MAECTERHDDRGDCDELRSQSLDLFRSIINTGEKSSHHKHQCCHDHTTEDTEYDHLIVRILRLFQLAGAQILSYHNADTGA